MAEALVRRGLAVTVVDQNAYPLGSTLDADAGGRVADALRGLGIEVRLEQAVDELEVRDGSVRGVVTGGERLPADLVVLGLGVEPNVALARDAGIELGPTGAIATDSRMRSSVEEIWAAGDCVEVYDRVAREPAYVALGTHANKQGRVVGTVATGGDAEFPGVLGTAVTRICDYEVGRTGLTEQRARELGYDVASLDIDSTSRASYLPDAEPIWVKVVVDRPSGRLLGAQVFGREGAAKRVDVLAVCLWNEMTVDEIPMVDLGYAPSVAPLWDPVLVATLRASSNE
jgi:NADPH-dependent 2,4-dienoyl-CoA reductase/sulfur reductase-like enzyme